MTKFDELIHKRGISSNKDSIPFWKLHISQEEVLELLQYTNSQLEKLPPFDSLNLSQRKSLFSSFDREICLLYALWWKERYIGGKTSWESMLNDYNINLVYLDWIKEAALFELKNHGKLDIPIYISEENRHMYFQSLLAQGGLPMQIMNNCENRTSFENFLYHLVLEYEEMDIKDWSNISVAKTIAGKYLNNQTLSDSEAFLDFSMELLRVYYSDSSECGEQEEIKEIVNRVKEKVNRTPVIEKKHFKISWEFKIVENKIELYYSVTIPREVILNNTIDGNENYVNIVSYFIENQLVGSYYRQGNRYLLMPGTSNNQRIKWDGKLNSLTLMRKIKVNFEEEVLINAEPPYMEEPMLLQFKNGFWVSNHICENSIVACLVPQEWVCHEVQDYQEFKYNDKSFLWINVTWENIPNRILHFSNNRTGETLELDNRISEYSISFMPNLNKEIIEEVEKQVVVNEVDIRRRFKCFKNDEICRPTGFRFAYKKQGQNEFSPYSGEILPCGSIVLKVDYPDGIQGKRFSFYVINGLSVVHENSHTICVNFDRGNYALLSEQNIETLGQGRYSIINANNIGGFASVKFRFYPLDSIDSIVLGLTSPVQKSCFFDTLGNMLHSGFPIAVSELHRFKFNLIENSQIILSYYHNIDETNICISRTRIAMNKGRYSLDILRDDIDRLVCINGFNDYHKYITIRILGVDTYITIRQSAFLARQCESENGLINSIRVSRDSQHQPATGLSLHAIAVNVTEESLLFRSDELRLVEDFNEPGKYDLPSIDFDNARQFVVFSDNSLDSSGLAPFFMNLDGEMTEEQRNQQKRESITEIQNNLLNGDEQEWNNVWFYMELVMNYHLSYNNSFNSFLAIANSPVLLTDFIVRIKDSYLMNYNQSIIVSELQKMEKDLSFRFHFLPSTCWQQQEKRLKNQYRDLIQEFPCLANSIDEVDFVDKKLSLLKSLLFIQFGEDNNLVMAAYYRILGDEWPNTPEYNQHLRDYIVKVNDALSDFDNFITPEGLDFVRVEYHPQRRWNNYRDNNVLQKLQYLAIVLPQCAAQYVHGADMNLWQFNPNNNCNIFIRRMINYMATYAPETYNELFITSLLRKPVNQNNQ